MKAEDLSEMVGDVFVTERPGRRQRVRLTAIKGDRVQLEVPGREDSFKIPTQKFLKFYQKVGQKEIG